MSAPAAHGDEIIRGIERSRAFILVLSSASNASGFVSREIERAVSKNKPIFTIRVEDVQPAPALELFVSSTQWIDVFKGRLARISTGSRSCSGKTRALPLRLLRLRNRLPRATVHYGARPTCWQG